MPPPFWWDLDMSKVATITEAGILENVVAPATADLNPEAARGLLSLKFDSDTTKTIRKLLRENNRGTISGEHRIL